MQTKKTTRTPRSGHPSCSSVKAGGNKSDKWRMRERPRPASVRSRAFLCDRPCHGGVSHAPLLSDSPGALALGDPLASDATLQLGQLGLATHVHPTLPGSSSALVGSLHDPLAFVLCQGLGKAMKPRPMGVVRSKCG